MAPGLLDRYCGIIRPTKKEQPMMLRLRPDERSTKEREERPTAVTMPKLTSTMPPSTGSGSMVSRAPNFPHIPLARKIRPAVKNAHRLAT